MGIDVDQKSIEEFCLRWRITELAFFGSVLREDFRNDSDVDVLVTFEPAAPWSLWDLIDMRDELAELFGRAVDLVERKALERSRNYIRRREILRHVEPVYAR